MGFLGISWLKIISIRLAGGSDGKESACNVGDLGSKDPLEKGMAIHSSILAWRILWTYSPGDRKESDMTE